MRIGLEICGDKGDDGVPLGDDEEDVDLSFYQIISTVIICNFILILHTFGKCELNNYQITLAFIFTKSM